MGPMCLRVLLRTCLHTLMCLREIQRERESPTIPASPDSQAQPATLASSAHANATAIHTASQAVQLKPMDCLAVSVVQELQPMLFLTIGSPASPAKLTSHRNSASSASPAAPACPANAAHSSFKAIHKKSNAITCLLAFAQAYMWRRLKPIHSRANKCR